MMEYLYSVVPVVPAWLVWSTVLVIAAYWYLTRKYDYWKKAGIPYAPGIPILGSLFEMFSTPVHEIQAKRYFEKGLMFGSYEGPRPVLTVGDLDILRDILVKDFQFFTGRRFIETGNPLADKMIQNLQGEDWKRVRTIITPAFTTGKIKKMMSIFIDSAKTLTSNFKTAASAGKPLDMKKLFGAFTMDVIASSAFGTKIDTHNDPENPFVRAAREVFNSKVPWRFFLFFLSPGFVKLFKINIFTPSAVEFFQKVTLGIMAERKQSGKKRNDVLQLFMDSYKEILDKETEVTSLEDKDVANYMGHEEGNEQIFKPHYSTKSLSNDEIIAQCIIFFLAGYETTAATLSFAAYELASNPDVQEKLIDEIDQVVNEKGELSYEAIAEMKYLEKVISETLRKYPPAIRTERMAEEDYVIKGHNVTVPKGMVVEIPVYAIHHDPVHYPDPERYDPDRFTQGQKSARHPYAYLPFGAGPRNCVAMRFALMEIKVCLAYVLSQFRFSTCSETQLPLEFHKGQILLQPKGVMLQVEMSENASLKK